MARLKQVYKETIAPQLFKELGCENAMLIPKITKITINMGLGEALKDKKVIEHALGDLEKITGQRAVQTLAKKSIAGFKVRDGWPVGAKVTLRREMMYEFLDRLVTVVIPRIRDFRGLNKNSFDGRGNYAFGLKEQIVFPEIEYDRIDAIRGMDIIITTSAQDDVSARALLKAFNLPLRS